MRPGADNWRRGRVCRTCGDVVHLNEPHDCLEVLARQQKEIDKLRAELDAAEAAGDARAIANVKIKIGQKLGKVIR